jgi:hypothetical protein
MTNIDKLMQQALPNPEMLVGVDLGQARDYTAITISERGYRLVDKPYNADTRDRRGQPTTEARQRVELQHRCRYLERLPLGMPYPEQVKHIVDLTKRLGGRPIIVADQTGVGRAVVDLLVAELNGGIKGTDIRPTVVRIGITGGSSVSRIPGGFNVPKVDLVGVPLVLMQNDRLHIAEGLELQPTLVRELLNFKKKINISTSNATYESWREGDHDDLVLSLAMGTWAGQELLSRKEYVRLPGVVAAEGPHFYRAG